MVNYSNYKNIIREISLPAAFVDLDLLQKNIIEIAQKSNTKKIRIASKSIRCPFILKYILDSNKAYQGIMCYSADEAVYLSQNGFDDILIAYPIVDKQKITNVCQEIQKQKQIIFMCDSIEHLQGVAKVASTMKIQAPICIDIDMSTRLPFLHFGVRRSPIHTCEQLKLLVEQITKEESLQFCGIMGYEAQIAGLADYSPNNHSLLNFIIGKLKKYSLKRVQKIRQQMVNMLSENGYKYSIVNGGGTGSLHFTSKEYCVTEVTVGSGFFASHLFDYYRDFQYLPAAFYAIEITRTPSSSIYTCHGGGYVASGTGKDKIPQVYLPKDGYLLDTEGAGEVQTPVCYHGKEKLSPGDPIFMRHSKAGELCEHFNNVFLIQDGKIVDSVKTYRGDGQCFL